MSKYIFEIIGLALVGSISLWLQPSAYGIETASGAEVGGKASYGRCQQCGSCLVVICKISCITKKVTEYKYACTNEDMCIPSITPLCKHLGIGETCTEECLKGPTGKCTIREVTRLVKRPVTKEVPVRTCTVDWVCPNRCSGKSGELPSASRAAPLAPSPILATPLPTVFPPQLKTASGTSLPSVVGSSAR